MITIKTENVSPRDDWYSATAVIEGKTYTTFACTRESAIIAIFEQIKNDTREYQILPEDIKF